MSSDGIQSVSDYLNRIEPYKDKSVIFRGMDNRFKILPTIVRSFCRNRVIIKNGGVFDKRQYESECEKWMSGGVPSGNDELRSQFHKYEKDLFRS